MPRRASSLKAKATTDMESFGNSQSIMLETRADSNAGDISDVPEGWRLATLGEVAHLYAGGSAPQGEQWFGGKNAFVRVKHLTEDDDWVKRWDLITDEAVKAHRLKLFPKGTIVLPKSGASIRLEKRAILTTDAYLVSHLAAVIAQRNIIDSDFLFYTLRSKRLAQEKADGYPTLNLSELKLTQVSVPPLPEQQAIALLLRTVQHTKEACERVIAATRQLKQSLLQYLFTYGPVPFDQADQVPLKETEIGLRPSHWEMRLLGDIAELKNGLNFKREQKGTGILTVDVLNMYGEDISIRPERLYRVSVEPREHYLLSPGDILLVRSSLKEEGVGWASLFSGFMEPATFCGFLIRLRLRKDSSCLPDLLVRFLRLPEIRSLLVGKSGKVAITNINQGNLNSLPVIIPPLSEQKAMAAQLLAVDVKLVREDSRRSALANLFQSLLHHLMTGKVRVTD
jgi:type I restriction enzyme S subunit